MAPATRARSRSIQLVSPHVLAPSRSPGSWPLPSPWCPRYKPHHSGTNPKAPDDGDDHGRPAELLRPRPPRDGRRRHWLGRASSYRVTVQLNGGFSVTVWLSVIGRCLSRRLGRNVTINSGVHYARSRSSARFPSRCCFKPDCGTGERSQHCLYIQGVLQLPRKRHRQQLQP
jgi:hypothetical protein